VEQRDYDGRHRLRLSENARNLNRHNAYGVSGRHNQTDRAPSAEYFAGHTLGPLCRSKHASDDVIFITDGVGDHIASVFKHVNLTADGDCAGPNADLFDRTGQNGLLTCAAHANILKHMAKMIQVRNVPDGVHRTLKARAALAGMSLSDFLLAEIRRLADRPSLEELRERLHRREPVKLKVSAAQAVREERDAR
jgi:plasmid stability protein